MYSKKSFCPPPPHPWLYKEKKCFITRRINDCIKEMADTKKGRTNTLVLFKQNRTVQYSIKIFHLQF